MEGETKPASRRGAIAVNDCDVRNAKQEDSAVDGLPPLLFRRLHNLGGRRSLHHRRRAARRWKPLANVWIIDRG